MIPAILVFPKQGPVVETPVVAAIISVAFTLCMCFSFSLLFEDIFL